MAFYTGYFDESQSEVGPHLVFGGLILDVENPQKFEDAWKAAIDPLPLLHTSPFLAGGAGFEQWNAKGLIWKQDLLKRAARVVERNALWTFAIALEMDSFRDLSARERFDEFVGHPYALCARYSAVLAERHWSARNGATESIKLVFEHRSKEDVQEVVRVFSRDDLKIPSFADKSVVPLQAADLIAVVHARKIMRKSNFSQVEPVYKELNQMLHSTEYLGKDLEKTWNSVKSLIVERPTPAGKKDGIYFRNDLERPRKPFEKNLKRRPSK